MTKRKPEAGVRLDEKPEAADLAAQNRRALYFLIVKTVGFIVIPLVASLLAVYVLL